jgi:hypothetical protein
MHSRIDLPSLARRAAAVAVLSMALIATRAVVAATFRHVSSPAPILDAKDLVGLTEYEAAIAAKQVSTIESCIRKSGFKAFPAPPVPVGKSQLIRTPVDLKREGYGMSDDIFKPPPKTKFDLYLASLPPADLRAYDRSRKACETEAEDIEPKSKQASASFAKINNFVEDRAKSDPRMATARRTWQQCVGGSGVGVTSPDEISTEIMKLMASSATASAPFDIEKVRAFEKALLPFDIKCRPKYNEAVLAARSKAIADVTDQFSGEIADVRTFIAENPRS